MPHYYDNDKEEKIKPLTKEEREALLSGNAEAYHVHSMATSEDYKKLAVDNEIKSLERQISKYKGTQSLLTQYANNPDMVIE